MVKNINKRISSIRHIRNKTSKNLARMISDSLFHSKILYWIECWGNTSEELINKIQRCQNKLLRIVLGKELLGKTYIQGLKLLKWRSIKEMVRDAIVKLAHKILNGDKNSLYSIRFKNQRTEKQILANKITHKMGTFGLNSQEQSTFRYQAFKMYNQLPDALTKIKNHQFQDLAQKDKL